VRSRRLIGIRLLPAAATLGNMICGFLAIFFCLLSVRAEYGGSAIQPRVFHPRLEQLFPTHVAAGTYLILLAMIFDALDGRLARMTRRTSEFGAQLDSLSDVVSFGIAPIALFLTVLIRPAGLVAGEAAHTYVRLGPQFQLGLLCGLVYLSCAAIRLARYNAENVKGEAAQKAFSGLPSPGAAAVVASLLALHENLHTNGFTAWSVDWANVLRWTISPAAFGVGLLMVSRLDYVHVFNVYVRRKRPPSHLVWLIVVLGVGWYSFEVLIVALAFGYVASGLALALWRTHQPRVPAPVPPDRKAAPAREK
jgi:CDP-diacylglycerol--serine O-phosphatidyltransferase